MIYNKKRQKHQKQIFYNDTNHIEVLEGIPS